MRRPLVAGNWKMHGLCENAERLAAEIRWALAAAPPPVEVVLCPPYTALAAVGAVLDGGEIALGGQDLHHEREGAFTGEVSGAMLEDLGCRFVIVGHSERRTLFGEDDATVGRKVRAAIEAGLVPILCVGETLDERARGRTREFIERQLRAALGGLRPAPERLVVAYEPVWAIGTGQNASAAEAQEAHAWLRAAAREHAGDRLAAGLRILYGGSVKPDNARGLFAGDDVDGGLIGGGSLVADDFVAIVHAAATL